MTLQEILRGLKHLIYGNVSADGTDTEIHHGKFMNIVTQIPIQIAILFALSGTEK